MDAVEFVQTKNRMCEALTCQECPMSYRYNFVGKECDVFINDCPKSAVEIVEEWSKGRPVKTRQSEFLKHYPNAEINKITGALTICPTDIFGGDCEDYSEPAITCDKCCKRFWFESVEE